MMKVRIGRRGDFIELGKYDDITIVDDAGTEYRVEANDPCYQGNGLKVYDNDGSVLVKPCTSNLIQIFSSSKIKDKLCGI